MSLVVQGVTRARGGTYTCTATNIRAAVSSNPLTLDVKYAPVCGEEQGKTQYSVAKKENAEVSCRVDANPSNVTFRWTFNNTAEAIDVPDGRFMVVGTESRVNYTPMTDLDYGTLLCWANNSVGTQSHPCIFHILPAGKPDPPHHCRVVDVALTTLQVSCLPGNDGGLDQRFLLQMYPVGSGQPVVEVSKMDPSFTVTRLQPATAYRVAVAALNHRGVSRPTQLQVVTGSLLNQPRGTSAEPTREREGGGTGGPKLGVGVAVGVAVAVLVVVVAGVVITFLTVRRRFQPSSPSPRTTTPLSPEVPTTLSLDSFCSPHHDLDLLSYAPDPGGGSIHISTVSVSASLQVEQQPTFTQTTPVPANPAVLLASFPPWSAESSSSQQQPELEASHQLLGVHVLNPT
ncbi:hypothetical protein Pmani_020036 [Petrolisthes manimaculis]|uniref:Uncharacterized protein n=1 Tax=Petrolisthes manimaculis TaxID=1843537 RepID=A0AAE1U306_9EUCA|nr:hypothetical protein Pmani_020036 [Petrolisthes manimaculis]